MKYPPILVLAFASATLAYGQTPPSIPHPIDGYLVTRQENNCLECHERPREIGQKPAKGLPVPAPASHYRTGEGKPEIDRSHFTCTSCHALR